MDILRLKKKKHRFDVFPVQIQDSSIFPKEQSKRIQERMEQIHHCTLYESLTTWYRTYCSYQVNICLSNTKNAHLHSAHKRF